MKRNTLFIVVVAVAAFFLLFNPLKWLQGNAVPRPVTVGSEVKSLEGWADAYWRAPEDYVVSAFATHDIVFLGDFYKIKQQVQFVGGLVPALYKAGIRTMGIEYGLADEQAQIDALVIARDWDETKARALVFDWVVTWGYQEYVDLYKAAWQVNSTRPAGAPPFRLVALSPKQDWSVLTSTADQTSPDTVARLYAWGVPDAVMASVIQKEILAKGLKAVIFCGSQHAFSGYRSAEYAKNAAKMKLPETRRAGAIVADAAPGKVMTIQLHAPWPDANSKAGLGYPAGGMVDALIDALPEGKRSGGWDLAGTQLGALSIQGSIYEAGTVTKLSDLYDGYIVLGPLREYQVVTAIPDFIPASGAERATTQFPGVKPAALTLEQVQASIAQDVDALQKTLGQLR